MRRIVLSVPFLLFLYNSDAKLFHFAKRLVILALVSESVPPASPRSGAFQPPLATLNRWRGPALLLLLIALANWRILFTDQYSWLNSPDLSSQVLPWLQFQAGEWKAGRFPQWSPYEWGGQNLIGQAQPSVVNPLNWVLYLAPLRRGWLREAALNWWFFLLHAMAGLNLYWLARSLGAARLAAVAGGLIFALFGFLGSVDWPQMISGLIWSPLVFLFLLRGARALTSPRAWYEASLAGVFLGLSWLSGHHQLPIFVSLATGATVLAWRFWPGVITFAVGGLVGAAQILPAYFYGREARRWVGMEQTVGWQDKVAYYVHEQYSNSPRSLLGVLLPGFDVHTSLFLGMTALALAFWAIRWEWARREVKLFFGLGIGALFYALGRWGGLEPILYSFAPMVEKARSPSMAAAIFTLSFAVLASLGLHRAMQGGADRRLPRAHWIFGGAVFALFSLGTLAAAQQTRLEERWLAVALVSLLVGWSYWAQWRGTQLAWVVLGALFVESVNFTYFNMANRHDPHVRNLLKPMSEHQDLAEYLLNQPGPVRITVDDKLLPYNFGDWYGVEVMGGYLASLSENLHDLDIHSERAQQLLGIGFHLGHQPWREGGELVLQGAAGINVWRYKVPPLPRARLVHRVIGYQRRDEYSGLLANPAIDAATTALMRGQIPELATCEGPESATILRREPSRVIIRTETPCRALLVLGDLDDKGWSVTVDGRQAERLTVYEALRGVTVEAGVHTVEWTYRAPGLLLGAALSFAGLLIVMILRLRLRSNKNKLR
jgi:hypothetical protein